jgi:Tfp pilus assembly protein PilN
MRTSILSKGFGGVTPLKTDDLSLPENREEWSESVRKTLLDWKSSMGIKGVVFGLEFKEFTHNFVEIPVTSQSDIRHALAFEMEKHLPLPPDEYLHDFITVESDKSSSRNLVFSIKKEKLEWITDCLHDTGLYLLGVKCTALEVLGEFISTESPRNVMLHFPGDRMHYIIGLGDYLPTLVKTAYSDKEAAADLAALSEEFKNGIFSFGLKDKSGYSKLSIRDIGYSTAYLLAASGLKRRRNSLNFVPEAFVSKRAEYYNYALVGLTAFAVLLFFLTSIVSYYKDVSAISTVKRRTEEIRSTSSELVEAKKELEAIEEKMNFLLQFRSRSNRYIEALKHLSVILPKDAWLTDFSAKEKGVIEIEGYAQRTADLIVPLENSSLFRNVEFSSPINVRDNLERFSIKMEIEE